MLRSLRALATMGALCAPAMFVQAAGSAEVSPIEPAQMRVWLMKIHDAARRQNFQGTFVVSSGNTVSSARIAHYADGGSQFERIESLDGQARSVFRHNELVQTFWPQLRVALVEQRYPLTTFPALLQAGGDQIAEFYEMRLLRAADRVAGHAAVALSLQPRDALRFGYRLWSEKESGLLLRVDTVDDRGAVLETSAFSDVEIGGKPQPDVVTQAMKKLDGYQVLRPKLSTTRLEAEGWSVRTVTPGFRQVHCVRRPLDSAARPPAPGSDAEVVQTIYSDGLTYVSIFIEKFDPERHASSASQVIGATHTLTRRTADAWITVVGDVPDVTLRAFAEALERTK